MQGRMAGLEDFLALDDENEDDLMDDQTESVIEDVMEGLIDEISLGLCFEVHRAVRNGTVFLDETDRESIRQYGVDVFGQVPMKKQLDCVCPNCSRNLAASRFAPHLEKCMGMGRNSSRIASRRIANSGKKDSDNESDDNDNDNDWSYMADRKAKKLKKDKSNNSPRRSKSSKMKNGDIPSVGSNTSDGSGSNIPPYESMALDDRKTLLMQTCGVISEHTKKMCTRSHRCPQHSEDQRKAVRLFLLGQQGALLDSDDVQVDIDTYDDTDNQALRDTLQWEAVSNPSPADSTSTVTSSSSKKDVFKTLPGKSSKKRKSTKSKKKSGKSTSAGTPSNLYEFP